MIRLFRFWNSKRVWYRKPQSKSAFERWVEQEEAKDGIYGGLK